jgi:soluble lytic murein transglycosylase-like protein
MDARAIRCSLQWRVPSRLVAVAGWLAFALLAPLCARAEQLPSGPSFDTRFTALGASDPADDKTVRVAGDDPAPIALSRSVDGPAGYRALAESEARREGLAPEIAEAVMAVESGFNPAAIGGAGEIGLMQILPSTARMLGFTGTSSDLAVPATNVHYGVTYLAQAWRLAGGDLCTAVMKYRAGHGETRFSYRSVDYCLAVRAKLRAQGFPVTGSVPAATFGESSASCRKCFGSTRVGSVNLAALNARLSSLVLQTRGGR